MLQNCLQNKVGVRFDLSIIAACIRVFQRQWGLG